MRGKLSYMMKRKCPVCSRVFNTDSPRRIYCSDLCSTHHKKLKANKKTLYGKQGVSTKDTKKSSNMESDIGQWKLKRKVEADVMCPHCKYQWHTSTYCKYLTCYNCGKSVILRDNKVKSKDKTGEVSVKKHKPEFVDIKSTSIDRHIKGLIDEVLMNSKKSKAIITTKVDNVPVKITLKIRKYHLLKTTIKALFGILMR